MKLNGGLNEKRNRYGTVYFEDSSGVIVSKCCRRCNEVKTLEEYSKQKAGLGGRTSICRTCDTERGRKYEEVHKQERSEYKRKYREANREKLLEYIREYDKVNKESRRRYRLKWEEKNKERLREVRRKYQEANKSKLSEKSLRWKRKNIERSRENDRKWRENNPLKVKLKNHRRKTRRLALPDTLTEEQYNKTLEYFGNKCALSDQTEFLEMDHAIPLSIGHGGTTYENCYPLTRVLNSSKCNRNIFEWYEDNKERLNLSDSKFNRLIEYLSDINGMTVQEYRKYYYDCFDEGTKRRFS